MSFLGNVLGKNSEKYPFLYCLTSDDVDSSHSEQVLTLCEAGVRLIQLRAKKLNKTDLLYEARLARRICEDFKAKLIINDHVEIANECDAHGVHLGIQDMSVSKARNLLGDSRIIGLTIHSKAEISQEGLPDVDYIGMGPFRKSETKTDLEAKLSLKDFSEMINSVHPVPVYLIGGLAIEDLRLCEQLGNNGIALCSALTDGKYLDTSTITNYVNKASDLEKNVVLA